jgi:hypothetical protein
MDFLLPSDFRKTLDSLTIQRRATQVSGVVAKFQTTGCNFYRGFEDDQPFRTAQLQFRLMTFSLGNSSSCNLMWYWYDQNNNLFALGETNFSKQPTITCNKGKVSKKITGIIPRCPKGFKKV